MGHFAARFDQTNRSMHMPLDHYAAPRLFCRWIILPLDFAKSAVPFVARSLCRSISLPLLGHSDARFGQVRRYIARKPPRFLYWGVS